MACSGVIRRGIYCAGEGVNALESKGKVDGEIKGPPPVRPYVVVSQGDFQVASGSAGWRGFSIIV